jgi:hypothetical protein
MQKSMSSIALPLVLWAAIGCGVPDEEAFANAVVTSALQTNENGGVGKEVVDTLADTCVDDPEEVARNAAARPSVAFIPSSCLDKSADGNRIHAELSECRGRFGRVTVEGGLDAVIDNIGDCRLHAEVWDSGDLVANGKPLEYQASAYVRLLDDVRDIDWSAQFSGTTRRGQHIEQSSHLAVLADAASCVVIDGSAEGRVGKWDYTLDIEGLAVCPDRCPSRGTVRARADGGRRERSLTVVFDGTTTAKVTGSNGDELDVEMICGPSDDER